MPLTTHGVCDKYLEYLQYFPLKQIFLVSNFIERETDLNEFTKVNLYLCSIIYGLSSFLNNYKNY